MSTFSDDMAAIAQDLISEFGEAGTFTRNVEGAYNPDSGEPFGESTITYSGYILPTNYSDYELANSIVQKGDIKVLAYKMSQVPAPMDLLTFGDFSGKLINIMRSRINGNDVIYTLQVRK